MACFYPRQALRMSGQVTVNGKSVVKFIDSVVASKFFGNPNLLSGLPCGQCTGCRLERSRQWAVRMVNESQLHDENCFITLTFDDEHLFDLNERGVSNPMSLHKPEFQKFMKRLRKRLWDDHIKRLKILHFFSKIFFFKKSFYVVCEENF